MNQSTPTPKISVIMPVWNGAKYLAAAIESILAQSFSDFELLMIDDNSTDESPAIIDSYAKRDSRIRYLKNRNPGGGLPSNLNTGIQAAKGIYLARMDQDDIALPHRFELQSTYLDSNPEVVALGTDALSFGAKTELMSFPVKNENLKLRLARSTCFIHPTVMLRRAPLVAANQYYTENLKFSEDWDYWVKISDLGQFANLKVVTLYYRLHPQSMTVASGNEGRRLGNDTVLQNLSRKLGMAPNASLIERFSKLASRFEVSTSALQLEKLLEKVQHHRQMQEYFRVVFLEIGALVRFPGFTLSAFIRKSYYRAFGGFYTRHLKS